MVNDALPVPPCETFNPLIALYVAAVNLPYASTVIELIVLLPPAVPVGVNVLLANSCNAPLPLPTNIAPVVNEVAPVPPRAVLRVPLVICDALICNAAPV